MKKNSRIILFALTVISIILVVSIVVSASPNGSFSFLYKVFGTPVTIVQNGFRKAADGVSDWFRYMFSYGSVRREIEELRESNADIPLLEDENQRLRHENDELRSLLGLREYSDDYTLTAASIIAEDVTDWFNTFSIDKGSAQGVGSGMAVIAPEGLVGVVYEDGLNSSKILTIVDEDNAFMCRISRTNELVRVRGVSRENNSYELRVDRIPATAKVFVGDHIVTAESGGAYPAGIMVGTVKSVSVDEGTGVVTAMIEPAVDLGLLGKVYVMVPVSGDE